MTSHSSRLFSASIQDHSAENNKGLNVKKNKKIKNNAVIERERALGSLQIIPRLNRNVKSPTGGKGRVFP